MSLEKKSLLDNRYELLATSSIYTYDDENLTSYADFLKKFGRYLGKDGFVDAQETIHRATLKQKQLDRLRKSGSEGAVTGSSPLNPNKIKFEFTSAELASMELEREKKHEKHLKLIEDQMIQSKQNERAFKRQEGDVKKEQRQIRQTVKEFESVISKKKLDAEKILTKNLEEKKTLEVEYAHKKEQKTKERTEQSLDLLVQSKDKGRKTLLVCNDLSRQYKLKMNELDLKQAEINNLHTDYEKRIRRKEEEEARVKKEIAEIALALNMETIKAKNDLLDFKKYVERTKDKQIKTDLSNEADLNDNIARLSLEGDQEKSQWLLKQREANRRIVDTRNNLETIYQKQRNLNEAAQIAEKEKKAAEIDKKIEDITNRRTNMQTKALTEKIEKSEEHEKLFKSKAVHKMTELEAKEHEDHLKHFQKLVQRDEELEQELFKTVKEAEFMRRKKDMELKKLQDQFVELKKQNAVQIKQTIAKAFAQEQEFEQKIYKEKAKLDKHQAEREETYIKLISHREKAKEDKYLLENHQKEHLRLVSVMEKSKVIGENKS